MYSFIVNPNARGGQGERIWRRLEKRLAYLKIEYQVFMTEEAGDASAFAAALTKKCKEPQNIIIVGGDGTVNETVDGLDFDGPVTLGYIPAGCGNDLGRSLRLPKNPLRCLKRIITPKRYRLLDYGVLSYGEQLVHRRFAVSAGIGLDAAVCQEILKSKTRKILSKVHLEKLSYALTGLKQFLFAWPAKGYLVLDGVQKVEFNHIYFISAHIHPYEGGGFRFAPEADPCDGKLTICVVHHGTKRRLIPILADAFLGRRTKRPGLRNYICNEVEIHMDRPMAVHTDGENCLSQKDIHIRCIPQKLRMMV